MEVFKREMEEKSQLLEAARGKDKEEAEVVKREMEDRCRSLEAARKKDKDEGEVIRKETEDRCRLLEGEKGVAEAKLQDQHEKIRVFAKTLRAQLGDQKGGEGLSATENLQYALKKVAEQRELLETATAIGEKSKEDISIMAEGILKRREEGEDAEDEIRLLRERQIELEDSLERLREDMARMEEERDFIPNSTTPPAGNFGSASDLSVLGDHIPRQARCGQSNSATEDERAAAAGGPPTPPPENASLDDMESEDDMDIETPEETDSPIIKDTESVPILQRQSSCYRPRPRNIVVDVDPNILTPATSVTPTPITTSQAIPPRILSTKDTGISSTDLESTGLVPEPIPSQALFAQLSRHAAGSRAPPSWAGKSRLEVASSTRNENGKRISLGSDSREIQDNHKFDSKFEISYSAKKSYAHQRRTPADGMCRSYHYRYG